MDKVAVIGFTNSGKTSYIIGMYNQMREGMKNFSLSTIETETDFYLRDDFYFREMWKRIQSGKGRSWPPPTDECRYYDFTLLHFGEKITDFELIEYKDRCLSSKWYQHQIGASSCFLVLLNGESFAYKGHRGYCNFKPIQASGKEDYKRTVASNLRNNGDLTEILKLLAQMAQEGIMIPPVAIVITKRDLIPTEYIEYISEIILENFSPIFGKGVQNHRLVMLSAVTLGEGIEGSADARPEDMEQPIAYALLSILLQRIQNVKLAGSNMPGNLSENGNFWNRFSGYVISATSLLDIFEPGKIIYVNGVKQNLREYFFEAYQGLDRR